MESRLIYIANEKIKSKVAWFKPTDTEWIYFGATTEINKSIVQQRIDSHFSETILYIAHTRLGSFETEKNVILDKIKNILGKPSSEGDVFFDSKIKIARYKYNSDIVIQHVKIPEISAVVEQKHLLSDIFISSFYLVSQEGKLTFYAAIKFLRYRIKQ